MEFPKIIKDIIKISFNYNLTEYPKKVNHNEFQNYLQEELLKINQNLILEYFLKYRRKLRYKKLYRGWIDCYLENEKYGDIAIEFENFSTIGGNSIRKFYTCKANFCFGIINHYVRKELDFTEIVEEIIEKIKKN